MKVAARLIEVGYTVSQPLEDAPYDLIADSGEELHKIQVKRGQVFDDGSKAEVGLQRVGGPKDGRNSYYEEHEVDVFCLYFPSLDEVYWVDFEEASRTTITLRWETPENGQKKGVKMASDYKV